MDIYKYFQDQVVQIAMSNQEPYVIDESIFRILLQLQLLQVQVMLLGPNQTGTATVLEGPFKGMKFIYPIMEGSLLPKVMGSYEQELHPFFLDVAAKKSYTTFVDIGCADGYYAVGIARLMPHISVEAYDTNVKARVRCLENAELNHVSSQIAMHEAFQGQQFEKLPAGKTLILCDIEGAEEELLDPNKYPALKALDIIVELHEVFRPGILKRVTDKFKMTHNITFVELNGKQITLPEHMKSISELCRMLLTYELRAGPTPWVIMTVK